MDEARIREDFDAIARLGAESGEDRYDRTLLALVPPTARRLLDVGCGQGRLTRALAGPGREVLGIDLSPAMVERARGLGGAGLRYECGDFMALALPAAGFDCIVTAATLHHLPAAAALDKMAALLAPGGRLVVHDLRRTRTPLEWAGAWALQAWALVARGLRGQRPLPPRAVRRAWARHGAGERYLTLPEVRALAARLPGAAVRGHWLWRYTLVWDKPAGLVASPPSIDAAARDA